MSESTDTFFSIDYDRNEWGYIPWATEETSESEIPKQVTDEITTQSTKKRSVLKSRLSFRRSTPENIRRAIWDYPQYSGEVVQQIFERISKLSWDDSALLAYMRNIMWRPYIEISDIHRFFVLNGYIIDISTRKLQKIRFMSFQTTSEWNTYILVEAPISWALTYYTDNNEIPIVSLSRAGYSTWENTSIYENIVSRFPEFSKIIPQDRHFESWFMLSAVIANEEAHVDFHNTYDNSRQFEYLDFSINKISPTLLHANEYLSDVASLKRVGPAFLVQSRVYSIERYTLQREILWEILRSFGVSPTWDSLRDISVVLETWVTPDEIMNAFLAYEIPIRKALEPFKRR